MKLRKYSFLDAIYGISSVGVLATYPLQTNLLAAYGIRKLVPDYTGDSLLLVRDSDDQELAFGFVGQWFDSSAALVWLAGSRGYIKTIYDQTGNGYNTLQATKASMAWLDIDYKGKPTIRMEERGQQNNRSFISPINTNTLSVSVLSVGSHRMASFFDGSTGNEMKIFTGGYPPRIQITDGLHFRGLTKNTDNGNSSSKFIQGFSSNATRLRLINDELDENLTNFAATTLNNTSIRFGDNSAGGNDVIGILSEELIYNVGLDDNDFSVAIAEQKAAYGIVERTHYMVALGDSNTYGYRIAEPVNSNIFDQWPAQIGILSGDKYKVINEAFNAWTFNDYDVVNFEDRYIEQLLDTSLTPFVLIMLGGNDISLGDSHATVTGQLDAMKADILGRAPDCNIVVFTILSRKIYHDTPSMEVIRLSYNQYIRDNYNDSINNLYVVDLDLNAYIGGDMAHIDTDYFEADDLHLNTAGHQEVANDGYAVINNI